ESRSLLEHESHRYTVRSTGSSLAMRRCASAGVNASTSCSPAKRNRTVCDPNRYHCSMGGPVRFWARSNPASIRSKQAVGSSASTSGCSMRPPLRIDVVHGVEEQQPLHVVVADEVRGIERQP